MGSGKAYAEVDEANKTVYKVKILILSKSTNKNNKISHLPWMKYFLLITLKSDI
jgi:hypothetical protein